MHVYCVIALTAGLAYSNPVPQDVRYRSSSGHLADLRAIHQYHTRNNLPVSHHTWTRVLNNLDELEDNLEDASDNYKYQNQHANALFLERRLDDFGNLEDHLETSLGYDRKKRSANYIDNLHAIHQYHARNNLPVNFHTVLNNLDELGDNLEDASDNYKYQNQHANAWYLERRLNDFGNLEDHLETSLGYDRKKRSANYIDNLHAIHQYHTRNNIPVNYHTVLNNLDDFKIILRMLLTTTSIKINMLMLGIWKED